MIGELAHIFPIIAGIPYTLCNHELFFTYRNRQVIAPHWRRDILRFTYLALLDSR